MEKTYVFNEKITSVQQLQEVVDFTDPFQVSSCVVMCLCNYADNVDDTIEMINYLKGPSPLTNYDIQFYRDRLADKPYLMESYIAGSSVENNYTADKPYTITVRDNPYSYQEDGYVVLYITSSGADSDRSLKLRKKGDNWYLWQNSLMVGIRLPNKDDVWSE
ncbi:MAG: DUF6935 domain-containing protein [Erysipelotrichaceae bacterium]